MKKTWVIKILLILGIILVLGAIGFVGYSIYKKQTTNIPNPVATMEIEGYGTVKIELYPDSAPNTVANFICLANRGFYNGLTFHRTMPNFVIQGGCKEGNGSSSPSLSDIMDNVENDKEYNIKGEFIANSYLNNIKHERGIISMARTDYSQLSSSITEKGYNSAGSQFFIMVDENSALDGLYAAFGKVIEGMDVVDKVANVDVIYRSAELKAGEEAPVDKDGNQIPSDMPKEKPVIRSLSVETYGVDYGTPETLDVFDYYSWMLQQYGIQGY